MAVSSVIGKTRAAAGDVVPPIIEREGTRDLANGGTMILLAAYIGFVAWRGNLGALWQLTYQDVVQQGFWKWFAAVIILYALASTETMKPLFAPLLALIVAAMLIETAESGQLQTAAKGFNSIFGHSGSRTTGQGLLSGADPSSNALLSAAPAAPLTPSLLSGDATGTGIAGLI